MIPEDDKIYYDSLYKVYVIKASEVRVNPVTFDPYISCWSIHPVTHEVKSDSLTVYRLAYLADCTERLEQQDPELVKSLRMLLL